MIEYKYLGIVFVVMMAPTALRADILGELFGVASGSICAVMSMKDFQTCGQDFDTEINSVDNQPLESLQIRKYCCAFSHLRDCIVDAMGDKCGDQRDSVVDRVVSTIISSIRTMSTDKCQNQLYRGTTGNIVCLNDFILILIAIGLSVLFVFVCCSTVKMCCRSGRRRRNGDHFMLLPAADKARY